MAVVGPADEIRRCAVPSVRLENFAVSVWLADMDGMDDDAVTRCCSHVELLELSR
jgi:hypothetical protein